jgi:uncharacterized repeat protein (TIGR01451 family)
MHPHPPLAYPIAISRLGASALALGALLFAQVPSQAQSIETAQACYAIADNGLPGDGNGGILDIDNLARFDFATGIVENLGNITGPSGPIRNIEAMSARPSFNELIVINGNEVGRVDPATGRYTPLGSFAPYADFDAVVIDLSSPNETRLLAVSKDPFNARDNVLVEATLVTENGLSVGVSAPRALTQIPRNQFPPDTDSIDGIALNNNTLYGVANRGPDTPNSSSEQYLVTIDQSSGLLTQLGTFEAQNTSINDIEDISFDLIGNLIATSGSNFSRSANTAFTISLSGRPGAATNSLSLASAGRDFEASACLPFTASGELLVVKRITAITDGGLETRFDDFVDQSGETADNTLFEATEGAFPRGLIQAPTALSPGDEVEYTVYVYNPSEVAFNNSVLCDPIEPPSILRSDSIEFAPPANNLTLSFADRSGFARAPLAPADDACKVLLAGATQFLSGPPGPTGGLEVGAGGGVVTDAFDLGAQQAAAVRFRITVGQGGFE